MQIRPLKAPDLASLVEIDGTIESTHYLHIEKSGEAMSVGWKTAPRPLRTKLIDPNRLEGDSLFPYRQAATGVEDGPALVAEHDGQIVAAAVAQADASARILRLLDVRVDYERRRQGLASAMVFQIIQTARDGQMRAVGAEARTNNLAGNQFLSKLSFELGGLDLYRTSNHDLVKETVTLLWYLALT